MTTAVDLDMGVNIDGVDRIEIDAVLVPVHFPTNSAGPLRLSSRGCRQALRPFGGDVVGGEPAIVVRGDGQRGMRPQRQSIAADRDRLSIDLPGVV